MKWVRTAVGVVAMTLLAIGAVGPTASAAGLPSPVWNVRSFPTPTNFTPGDAANDYAYEIYVENSGTAATDPGVPFVVTDTLPPGLQVKSVELVLRAHGAPWHADFGSACTTEVLGEVATVRCTVSPALEPLGALEPTLLHPSEGFRMVVHVSTPPSVQGLLENRVEVEGGGAVPSAVEIENEASPQSAPSGIFEFNADPVDGSGGLDSKAASRPYQYTTTFAVNTERPPPTAERAFVPADGDLKNISVPLPPGFVGNPTVALRCTARQFNERKSASAEGENIFQNECPDGSAIGFVAVNQVEGFTKIEPLPLYNLVPPKGMPAQFGFQLANAPIYIDTRVRTGADYGITAYLPNTSQASAVEASSVTIWGVPADSSHDRLRGSCLRPNLAFSLGNCPAGMEPKPFFRLPTSCSSPQLTTFGFNTWQHPTLFVSRGDSQEALRDCAAVPFDPTIGSKPTTNVADAPSGLAFTLHLPQKENEAPEGLGEADLKDATVTLPDGLLVNPSSANGLGSCSEAQVGYEGEVGGTQTFSPAPAECPDASKIGTVEVNTPLLEHPLPGAIYLASQEANPFHSLLAIYITVYDPISGVVVKLPAKVEPDPVTGRLATTVRQSPQLPFEDFHFGFFEGARAPLRTPAVCGTYSTTSILTPWSAPESGPPATPSDSFAITTSPSGGSCPTSPSQEPNNPAFQAGTVSPTAGVFSPFVLHLGRNDGSQELKGLEFTLPKGLLAKLAGVSECSDAQIAAAKAREVAGQGAAELSSPSCPASSKVGTVTVGAGAGPAPLYVQGSAYLTGPYKGAPLGVAIITPAVAGPFDLGAVVVRAALEVNPETAVATVKSDPFPTILDGIPLDVRSISAQVDRSQFTLNPTSCNPSAVTGTALSVQGQPAALSNRFQVGECGKLKFKPKLAISLKGQTRRIGHPALKATLTYPKGGAYANVARAQVNLPHGEFLDQGNLNKTCTKPVLLAGACPASTVYGKAKAWTPLLDKPLVGNVYLVGGYGYKLPALVAELNGQIKVLLVGKVDSGHNNGIRTTFEAAPDAPVEKFVLEMKGGKKYGLLENSETLCKASTEARQAIANFTAQNGKVDKFKPVVENECGKKKAGKKKGGKKSKKHASHQKHHG